MLLSFKLCFSDHPVWNLFLEFRFFGKEGVLFFLVNPPGEKPQSVFWSNFWSGKLIPVGQPVIIDVPMGNDIMAPKQSPVQCSCTVNQCLTIRSLDYFSDQFIDSRILDSHKVSAAVAFCSIRVPVIVLLITGGEGLTDNHHHHVKLKGPDPVNVLCLSLIHIWRCRRRG